MAARELEQLDRALEAPVVVDAEIIEQDSQPAEARELSAPKATEQEAGVGQVLSLIVTGVQWVAAHPEEAEKLLTMVERIVDIANKMPKFDPKVFEAIGAAFQIKPAQN